MVARIADAGFLIALKSGSAVEKKWARSQIEKWGAPFYTCEGAIIEAAHFVGGALIGRMLEDGDLEIAFSLSEQLGPVLALLAKYNDQPMDLTDACVVRMAELFPDCLVFTVDRDFDVYRRFGKERIPVVYPS